MISLPRSKDNDKKIQAARLTLSAGAKRDLQSISRYTQKQWGAAQKQYYLKLINKSLLLSCNSGSIVCMGKERLELSLKQAKQHNVYYRIMRDKADAQNIIIVRILHTRMKPSKHKCVHIFIVIVSKSLNLISKTVSLK